jgi:hypothetical protein
LPAAAPLRKVCRTKIGEFTVRIWRCICLIAAGLVLQTAPTRILANVHVADSIYEATGYADLQIVPNGQTTPP